MKKGGNQGGKGERNQENTCDIKTYIMLMIWMKKSVAGVRSAREHNKKEGEKGKERADAN